MTKIAVMFADNGGCWDERAVEVPEEIAKSESQDKFLTWVYSTPEGQAFQETWSGDVMAVFVLCFSYDTESTYADETD